jgi:hypothetical protein
MNKRLRQFEKESKLEIFGLGAKRHIWEAALEKYAELIVKECIDINKQELSFTAFERLMNKYQDHFAVEESKGWVCPKCGIDRTKNGCPQGFGATVDGRCPMTVEAQ